MSVTIHCDGIDCNAEFTIPLPDGWDGEIEAGMDGTNVFCPNPDCQLQKAFFDAVCPGCVAGFPECGLGHAFYYCRGSKGLTPAQRVTIEQGVCPFRVNGTLMMDTKSGSLDLEDIYISTRAPVEAAHAVLRAVDAVMAAYHPGGKSIWEQDR